MRKCLHTGLCAETRQIGYKSALGDDPNTALSSISEPKVGVFDGTSQCSHAKIMRVSTADNKTPSTDWFWDRYWQANRIAACLTDCAGNYQTVIRHSWEEFFKGFPDGSRLLDIGTGNGAIAIIAHETAAATGSRFEIHGVDRADIDPQRFINAPLEILAGIHFQGRIPAESLPFTNAYFDGVTGQYALEYTDTRLTVPELRRVAKSGARLRFLLHAQDATPVKAAERGLGEIEFLLKTLDLTGKARHAICAAFAFEKAAIYDTRLEAKARRALEAYLVAASKADARIENLDDKTLYAEVLVNMKFVWDHRHEMTLDYILKAMDSIETDIHAHAARLENMCKVALSTTRVNTLCHLFNDSGFEKVKLAGFHAQDDQRLLGWELSAVVT